MLSKTALVVSGFRIDFNIFYVRRLPVGWEAVSQPGGRAAPSRLGDGLAVGREMASEAAGTLFVVIAIIGFGADVEGDVQRGGARCFEQAVTAGILRGDAERVFAVFERGQEDSDLRGVVVYEGAGANRFAFGRDEEDAVLFVVTSHLDVHAADDEAAAGGDEAVELLALGIFDVVDDEARRGGAGRDLQPVERFAELLAHGEGDREAMFCFVEGRLFAVERAFHLQHQRAELRVDGLPGVDFLLVGEVEDVGNGLGAVFGALRGDTRPDRGVLHRACGGYSSAVIACFGRQRVVVKVDIKDVLFFSHNG